MRVKTRDQPRGIVLVVTLLMVVVIAIILTSYLSLANQINSSVARSQSWNEAIPVLESGVEEALTQLYYAGTNSSLLASNSWTHGPDGLYHKTRVFSDGSYFNASIQSSANPVIISTGFVAVLFGPSSTTNYLRRQVKVVAQQLGVTPRGLNAVGKITMSGSAVLDSFDSSDPNYSANGLYVASKRKATALALSNSGASGAVSLAGSSFIYGSVATGPSGTVTTGGTSAVGDIAWDGSHSGVEAGHSVNDANVQFNDATAPFTYGSGTTPSSGSHSYGGTNYNYLLGSGNYNMSSLSLSGIQTMAVTGNTTLYVNGSFSTANSAYVYIARGATLTMYVNGNVNISGAGVVNGTQSASQCAIYGLPGCTTITCGNSGAFIGTVYAPEAALTVSGSGGVSGGFTASTITVSNSGQVHYDEHLTTLGGSGYAVMSWNEI
ncbi:MAG: collagen-binding domain-containing protein [Verrucomicrobiota bacterium]|jgi:hypothetical protein